MHAKQKMLVSLCMKMTKSDRSYLAGKQRNLMQLNITRHIISMLILYFSFSINLLLGKKNGFMHMMHHIKKKDVQLDGGHKDIYGIELLFFAIALNC
jgi:hypothetical protein